MIHESVGVSARWSAVRRIAGYSAASTLSLYLVVKAIWIVALLSGNGSPEIRTDTADWVVLNAVTVGMSLIGVVLGLALAQPWGRRLPAAALIFVAWAGVGFLIPMLPYMLVTAVLGAAGAGTGTGTEATSAEGGVVMHDWDTALISIGFAGMAMGLAVGLPIYMWERWPHAFVGRLDDASPAAALPRSPWNLHMVRTTMVVACALGILWLYWAVGGTLGLDPARLDPMDLNGRLLSGNSAIWAFIGAWSVRLIAGRRSASRLPFWIPMALAFTASGSLFAWSGWKLTMTLLRPGGYVPAEDLVVAVVQHAAAIGAGLAIMAVLVQGYRARALMHSSGLPGPLPQA
ncbi:hypothetical protein [Sphaerisporangium sp. TRM90804]|uniref:hypothetical protein n=1 Tax=Sphaerisporangium sp. TRM90804 TaxID=3031113 RepID=UPI0024493E84|nr:hypothetical protein [Sphaerisporangium sp. TRM90804]MDH2427687.1 hypothetical protein [Sphaerisporangium sp. TRM90804]